MSGANPDRPSDPAWEFLAAAEQAPSRRRAWPWLVALVLVAALAAGAWFLGEWIAREFVSRTIRNEVVTRLALPADQKVDVSLAGAVLPQLISGSLEDVTVSSDDVTLGALTGDVTVRAEGVPLRGGGPARGGSATVRLDQQQLRGLLGTLDGFPADTVTLDPPDVTMSTQLTLLSIPFPIGVSLTPSVHEGDLALSPSRLRVGGAEVTADALRGQFGGLADTVLREWDVCVAQYLPAGVTLGAVRVGSDALVADLTIDGRIVNDPALQADGACP